MCIRDSRFGSHIHILDWALHLDEGTPHIHERHVFDCENRYGELCPQQEKALEELGIPLPKPEQPKGKHNNRKQTFDAVCRTILFDIAKRHGLHLEQEPSYGGRDYLEKQDYILMKQKEQLATQEQKLEDCLLYTSYHRQPYRPRHGGPVLLGLRAQGIKRGGCRPNRKREPALRLFRGGWKTGVTWDRRKCNKLSMRCLLLIILSQL